MHATVLLVVGGWMTAENRGRACFEAQCQQPSGIFVVGLFFDRVQRFIYQVVELRFRHRTYHPVKMCKFNDPAVRGPY